MQHFTRGRSPPARNDDSTRHTNAAAASQPPSCGVQDPASQGGRENSEVNRLKAELQEAQDENKTMQGLYGRLQDRQQAERERADDPPEDYYDDHDDDAPPRRGGKAPAAADDEWWGDSSDEEHRFTRRKEGDKVQVPAFPTLTNLRNWKHNVVKAVLTTANRGDMKARQWIRTADDEETVSRTSRSSPPSS